VKRINEDYSRFVGRIEVVKLVDYGEGVVEKREFVPRYDTTFAERVRIVLRNSLLPWAILKGEEVLLTSGFAEELRRVIGDIGGLKSIAELLGWEYRERVSLRMGKRVTSVSCIAVPLDELLGFLHPESQTEEQLEEHSFS